MSTEQFFASTPHQYHVLMARHREKTEHQDFSREFAAAIVAHTVATFAGKQLKDGKDVAYGDFMPSQTQKLRAARAKASAVGLHNFLQGLVQTKDG